MRNFVAGVLLVTGILAGGAARSDEGPVTAHLDADGVQRIEIVADSYSFTPAHIIVQVNKPVELAVRKAGWLVPHDIVVDAPEAGITVQESLGGEAKKISFTPTKKGSYPFFCSKKPPFLQSHRDKGMSGMLEVVE
jgi:plastocyanin